MYTIYNWMIYFIALLIETSPFRLLVAIAPWRARGIVLIFTSLFTFCGYLITTLELHVGIHFLLVVTACGQG